MTRLFVLAELTSQQRPSEPAGKPGFSPSAQG